MVKIKWIIISNAKCTKLKDFSYLNKTKSFIMESHYIKIYTGSFILVTNIVSKLEAAGITPIVKDETESARLAGFGPAIPGQQEVYVHESEIDKATPIVQGLVSEMEA